MPAYLHEEMSVNLQNAIPVINPENAIYIECLRDIKSVIDKHKNYIYKKLSKIDESGEITKNMIKDNLFQSLMKYVEFPN